MDKKQIEAMLLKRSEKEEKTANQERSKFLEHILNDRIKKEFKNYEKGYRAFSVECPKGKHFSMDDEILTTIINAVTCAYECDYKSLALTDIIYTKSYTFIFYKENKKIRD
jgi:hypothetical protein